MQLERNGGRTGIAALMALAAIVLPSLGCRQDMHDQPKYEPFEASEIFADGTSARHLVEGTVARGLYLENDAFLTGRTAEDLFVVELPVELNRPLLERGRNRFDVFCSPCHGRLGDGLGMVVQRGFKQPRSLHEPRLRESAVGYFFGVISNGFGEMSSYASQIRPADRWAIAAYIKALQLSRHVPIGALSPEDARRLEDAALEEESMGPTMKRHAE